MPRLRYCTAPECDRRHYAKGCCKKHYTQILRYGRLTPEREKDGAVACTAPSCERSSIGTDIYCRKHQRQVQLYGRLTPELEHEIGNVGCRIPGCPKQHRAHGLCPRHYNRVRWYLRNNPGMNRAEACRCVIREARG